jgi:16S rRNA (cytosine1402-N4)-methyltransferase
MLNEVNEFLVTKKDGVYIDCTAGEGGHSSSIYDYCEGQARVIAVDVDYEVLEIAEERLKSRNCKIEFFKAPYQEIDLVINGMSLNKVDGFLMDLGVSTYQLKGEGRGFTFMNDEPLDMRMDTENYLNASMICNQYQEEDIANIIFEYGQEYKFARRIARNIVNSRPINSTFELNEAVRKALPNEEIRRRNRHFATKTYQALRIEVNQEFKNIKTALKKFEKFLNPGGRIVVMSFHSLEDKIIKEHFKNSEKLKIITKKPLVPSKEEVSTNPRSRSTKLRVAEFIG